MGYGQVNVGGSSKLQEAKYEQVNKSLPSGSDKFNINFDTGHDIKGIKDCEAIVTSSGGSFKSAKFSFNGKKIIFSGTKIHTNEYLITLNYTILY